MIWAPLANLMNHMAAVSSHSDRRFVATVGMYEWEEKPWGRQRVLAVMPHLCSLHELEIKADGFCSFHYHDRKQQALWCTSGTVEFLTITQGGNQRIEIMTPGDVLMTLPRDCHQFKALTDATMLELYVPIPGRVIELEDIVRVSSACQF